MRKLLTVVVLTIFISLLINLISKSDSDHRDVNITETPQQGKINVVIDSKLPDYFTIDGMSFGFSHDILSRFANDIGAELSISSQEDINVSMNMLASGNVDIVVTLPKHKDRFGDIVQTLLPAYEHKKYVILANKSKINGNKKYAIDDIKDVIEGSNVIMKRDFTVSKAYNYWLDNISNSALISYDNSYNLISSLDGGSIDFLVCEMSEMLMQQDIFHNVDVLYTFQDEESSVMFANGMNMQLVDKFNGWLKNFKENNDYAELYSTYFKHDLSNSIIKKYVTNKFNRISEYDDIIKNISNESGYDWRFISAIAYNESRFKPNVTSKKGAKGIMQIMPSTNRVFNKSNEDILNPKTNIEVAIKLIDKIESSLRFSDNTSDYDKLCIILACYNGGIGHVLDARKLAAKYGENPNSWPSVAKYLKMKSDSKYYNDDIVTKGRFLGGETLRFVSNVMDKYSIYCNTYSM